MREYGWMKYVYFICVGLFICLVICPLTETLGMHNIERLLYILGGCVGVLGCLMPVNVVIERWSKEK